MDDEDFPSQLPILGVDVTRKMKREPGGEPPGKRKMGAAGIVEKFKLMEEEMDRFEAEISGPLTAPPMPPSTVLKPPGEDSATFEAKPRHPARSNQDTNGPSVPSAQPFSVPVLPGADLPLTFKTNSNSSAPANTAPPRPPQMLPPPPPPPMFVPHQLQQRPSFSRPNPMPPPPPPAQLMQNMWGRSNDNSGGGMVGPTPPPPPMQMPAPPPPPGLLCFPATPPAPPTVSSTPITVTAKPVLNKSKVTYASKPAIKKPTVTKPVKEVKPVVKPTPPVVVRSVEVKKPEVKPIAQVDKKKKQQTAMDMVAQVKASTVVENTTVSNPTNEEVVPKKKEKKPKKIVRTAGGETWEDNSLLEWDHDDFRIFCGDLGNDVTDEILCRTFGRYQSFLKAKVIRDRRTGKSKGFGFLSFKDPSDFTRAMKDWNGKYVGSRPIKLRKSSWKDRNIHIVKKKQQEKLALGLL